MELLFAENHPPMTHFPIATSILAAVALIASVIFKSKQKELTWAWAILSIIAFITCVPAIVTGMSAAIGRMWTDSIGFVPNIPENDPIALHQRLGIAGAILALITAYLGYRHLRGKTNNRILVLFFSVALAIIWSYGGHLGGKTAWSAETFPAYQHLLEDNAE
jgi:uncharacterized membrane protein